jgi:lipopolysaccharide export system protein LptC
VTLFDKHASVITGRGWLTLGLALAAGVTAWSIWQHEPPQQNAAAANARSDYVLQEFEVVVLDKQGHESFTVRAPRLARSPGDRTMTLATPTFFIPAAPTSGAAPTREAGWVVTAKSGWVSGPGDELRLTGAVSAKTAGVRAQPIEMTTEQLNVFPDANRATSPTTVTVTQPGSILRGHGMEALLDSKRVRLTSNVKVHYAPQNR